MENIPALKKENFTTTIDNYVSKLDFQLSKIKFPNLPEKNVMNSWISVAADLMKDPEFGETLSKGNGWMDDEMKKLITGAPSRLEIAKRIYAYVRDNFTCTDHNRKYL